ncbi:MAG: hypothetical protein AAB213_01355 [Candidatus Omnitrophota bacterium]
MRISILDAQHTIFQGVVSEAVLPATDGEIAILDNHESIFVALSKGLIRLVPVAKLGVHDLKPIRVHRGLARMRNNELIILVE